MGEKIKLNISIRLKESYCKRLFSTANDLTKCSEKRNIWLDDKNNDY